MRSIQRTIKLASLLACLAAAGCGRPEAEPPREETAGKGSSTLDTVVDGVTGRSAVRAGKQAEEKLRRIGAEKDSQLNEILGE